VSYVEDLFGIAGKVALVTGGSRGIGLMIAEGMVQAGARVYISSRKADVCDREAARLSKLGTCVSLPADLGSLAGCTALAEALQAKEKTLDVLVNSADAWLRVGSAKPDTPLARVPGSVESAAQSLIPT
jgi:NAD(P)-dependent dehydrogenase (short-subunit alcohol dehydrogenase family)